MADKSKMNYQGGKLHGAQLKEQEAALDKINQTYLEDEDYQDEDDYPDLKGTLENYKQTFIEYDQDKSGALELIDLKRMMEKLDQAKTHLELKNMIAEVDREDRGAISYNDFLFMMLGKKSSVLKLILLFEEKMKTKERPTGPPPKRSLSQLP